MTVYFILLLYTDMLMAQLNFGMRLHVSSSFFFFFNLFDKFYTVWPHRTSPRMHVSADFHLLLLCKCINNATELTVVMIPEAFGCADIISAIQFKVCEQNSLIIIH